MKAEKIEEAKKNNFFHSFPFLFFFSRSFPPLLAVQLAISDAGILTTHLCYRSDVNHLKCSKSSRNVEGNGDMVLGHFSAINAA